MRRSVFVFASLVVTACSSGSSPEDVDAGRAPVAESEVARLKLLGLREHQKTIAVDHGPGAVPVLEAGTAARFTRSGEALVPSFDVYVPDAARVRVELPSRASQPVVLEDVSTHKAIRFALIEGRDVEAELADGLVLYEGAVPGGDLVHRPVPEGTEDYVFYAAKPAREELRYRVDVSAFAGLRLVGNTVEMVDDAGRPRLRATNPWIYDHRGARHEGRLSIEGCAFNGDPSIEALRRVVPPGASSCEIVVAWGQDARLGCDGACAPLSYPIVVDPLWGTTSTMKSKRKQAGATAIGSILGIDLVVVGGHDGTGFLSSVESCSLDGGGCTFSSWASMSTKRSELPFVTQTPTGGVVVIGGRTDKGVSQDAEFFAGGTWSLSANQMSSPRVSYGAQFVGSSFSKVLVFGGSSGGAVTALSTAEELDLSTKTFAARASMATARWAFAHTRLPSGKIFVHGGYDGSAAVGTAEIWDPATNTWSGAGSSASRMRHQATVVGDVVLVAGGTTELAGTTALATTSLYTIGTNAWATGPSMVTGARQLFGLVPLGGSRALAFGGGVVGSAYLSSAEVYDRGSNAWVAAGTMPGGPRGEHAVVAHYDAIAIGGNTSGTALATVDRFTLLPNGEACTEKRLCSSGNCVDGVCCSSSSCTGGAKCNNPIKKGTCSKALGVACSGNADCDASKCVDGVCCDSTCTGPCQACTAALKGSGTNGTCGPIAAGTDPQNECADAGAASCGTDGSCNGAGGCRLYAATTVCRAATCVGTVRHAADSCNGSGTCVDAGSVDCAPFLCSAGACTTSCSTDAQCAANGHCEGGVCKADLDQGKACTRASQCKSGSCVDGVCCNTACTGTCMACSKTLKEDGSADGTCGLAKSGTDPRDHCTEQAKSTCGRDGACDGGGKCRLWGPGTACGAVTCDLGIAKGQICDGFGACKSDSSGKLCSPFKCASGEGCKTKCAGDIDCEDGNYCEVESGTCKPKKPNASECTAGTECGTGICVDGVCCNALCDGQCESCTTDAAKGTCVPVSGAPPAGKPACDDPPKADGDCTKRLCDGSERKSCAGFVGAAVSCKAATCEGGVAKLEAKCTGKGTCDEPVSVKCEPFTCDGSVCGTSCERDEQCAPKFRCDTAKKDCVPRDTSTCSPDGTKVVDPSGAESSCAPFVCQAGACKESCGATTDCAAGFVCETGSGRCVAQAVPTADEGGCGCRTPRGTSNAYGGALALLAAIAAVARRRGART